MARAQIQRGHDPSLEAAYVDQNGQVRWVPIDPGTVHEEGPPPTWRNAAWRFCIEQHCDGYYLRPVHDGRVVRLASDTKVGPMVGPFTSWWSARGQIKT